MKKVSSVEEYIEVHEKWTDALSLLRSILLETELKETLKWSAPVYTINGKNVIGIGAFKEHMAIWFFNGVFLKDEKELLVNAQEGSTKALRQMRFTSIEEINKATVLAYTKEAIENQKQGKELKPDKKKELVIPNELKKYLDSDKEVLKCFKGLTAYKQREYADYISSAKREATKLSRLEKIAPMIRSGLGLNDKYKNC